MRAYLNAFPSKARQRPSTPPASAPKTLAPIPVDLSANRLRSSFLPTPDDAPATVPPTAAAPSTFEELPADDAPKAHAPDPPAPRTPRALDKLLDDGEAETAERYLEGETDPAGSHPGLATVIDDIATAKLDGSAPTMRDASRRESAIGQHLLAPPRMRPGTELPSPDPLEREALPACRSVDGATTAARMASEALDAYQRERYGADEHGAPRPPPTAEDPRFDAWTQRGRQNKRRSFIAETIEHWRREIAPKLVQRNRAAIIPLEVQFGRELLERERQDRRAAEDRRRAKQRQVREEAKEAAAKAPPTPGPHRDGGIEL